MPTCFQYFPRLACGPHPEGIIFIQAILEVHDIDEAVCRAANHPFSGLIAAVWKADLHRQGSKFTSRQKFPLHQGMHTDQDIFFLDRSPRCLMYSSTVNKTPEEASAAHRPQCSKVEMP